jgi:alpha 1,2-mannosyltransferase
MDSDNLPLADPADLFETVEYKSSGSAFWSDVSKDHPDNAVFRVLGIPCNDDHWTAETGQMVFDKRGNDGLNLAVLHLAEGMMGDAEWGKFGWGDKDTFVSTSRRPH